MTCDDVLVDHVLNSKLNYCQLVCYDFLENFILCGANRAIVMNSFCVPGFENCYYDTMFPTSPGARDVLMIPVKCTQMQVDRF